MLKLNVIELLDNRGYTKYQLFNKLNNIRSLKGESVMSYTNFLNIIQQKNKSVLYQDLDELCEALDCDISELLTLVK